MLAVDPNDDVKARVVRAGGAKALAICARDSSPHIRSLVAERRDAPAEVLIALARDPEEAVRMAVAKNNQKPEEATKILAEDDSGEIRKTVNPALWRMAAEETGEKKEKKLKKRDVSKLPLKQQIGVAMHARNYKEFNRLMSLALASDGLV
jgi:hypothetical protein